MEKVTLYYSVNSARSSEDLLIASAEHFSGEYGFTVHREQGKKPYFENLPELHFSVSHSGSLWVCAFALHEIGCDIQVHREIPRYMKLSERWFHENEAKSVSCERDFYNIWSRKESFVKALGCGIDENFRKFDTTSGMSELLGITLKLHDFRLPCDELQEYSAAIAYHDDIMLDFVSLDKIS